MKCERARELFSEYLEGSIDYALAATVRAHIDECDSCGRELDLFKQTWDMLGVLPEVEPPSGFRHEVVMRAARIQHQRTREAKQGALGLSWDYLFGRLVPARAIAVACAGAALALILLRLPQDAYTWVSRTFTGITIVDKEPETSPPSNGTSYATTLSQYRAELKSEWKQRKLGRNTIWIAVTPSDVGEGRSLYQVTLCLNQDALVEDALIEDITARIGAQVYLLPPNEFAFDAERLEQAKLIWRGNVLVDEPAVVPIIIDLSYGSENSANLLVTWRFRTRHFAQIIYLPTGRGGSSADSTFSLSVTSGFRRASTGLYSTLQRIAQDHGVTIIANAYLVEKPSVVDLGASDLEEALRKTLIPIGLTWRFIDDAIYIDREPV